MRRVTLGQVLAIATVAIAIVVGAAFTWFVRDSRARVLRTSQTQQALVARRVESRVVRELGRAAVVLEDIDRGIRSGAIGVDEQQALEATLYSRLIDDKHLEEVAFTRADVTGYDGKGEALVEEKSVWQISVQRRRSGAIWTTVTRPDAAGFGAKLRERAPDASFLGTGLVDKGRAPDPTRDYTFSVIAAKEQRGRAAWSDLHWSALDYAEPQESKRVVASVQKSVDGAGNRFLGVLRVGIVTTELEAIARTKSEPTDSEDVERVALLATSGRDHRVELITRVHPSDRIERVDDDLRVISANKPPEIASLLASPLVHQLDRKRPMRDGTIDVNGVRWLVTLCAIDFGEGGTEGWMVAVLVPESRYTAELIAFERTFLMAFGLTLVLVLAIGGLSVAALRRGLGRITTTTTRMRAFDFTADDDQSAIRDVDDVMKGLERAKTVVRAMGKYVPIDLVRRLYGSNQEPQLGGELLDVSILFTDIEGFTTLSEKLPPDELARRLGDYLAAMTTAIEASGGTIDKYIGDAVMALWNAPSPVPEHAKRACRATLDCMKACAALYTSKAWEGLPPLVTRFGIHQARVMVGHFGAPTRLSYTALGDGVNLAARLEPLCKQYGVVVLVSAATAKHAAPDFVFRRIDRVAVKGKSACVDVYELLGEKDGELPRLAVARTYEAAFDAYLARDFTKAITLLEPHEHDDPPSEVLLRRCRALAEDPPPPSWNGVHVASSK